MKSALYPYQNDLYTAARDALAVNRSVCVQLATGGGKTPVASAMVESVFAKNKRAWFITPRINLIDQASDHFKRWGVPHGRIDAKNQESNAFKIFVVSKETLQRRLKKIKNWPDLIIIDEAHINLDFQIELYAAAPVTTKFILYTATPERADGRGLSTRSGGIADTLVEGPSIPWLTSQGYLTPLRYFSPPLEGLADLKFKGTEADEEQLEDLLQRKKIYGEVVGHYEKYGKGRPALGFCRSVKSAYLMAERFRDKGFNFHCIEGKQNSTQIKQLLNALRDGNIDGLTTADLVLYGVDVPRVEYGFSVRPTLSRALMMQMIGRIIRTFEDEKTGYKKQDALWFDHVNMILEHGIETASGVIVPPHYAERIPWNFHGTEKRKKEKQVKNARLCPHLDFMYCDKPSCSNCPHNPDKSITDARKPLVVIPAELEEVKKPVALADMALPERRQVEDEIGSIILEYKENPSALELSVKKLIAIADGCGYSAFWVYHRLNNENHHAVNIPVLAEIQRQKGYKSGWLWFAKDKIRKGLT